jgi:hypothetical protein
MISTTDLTEEARREGGCIMNSYRFLSVALLAGLLVAPAAGMSSPRRTWVAEGNQTGAYFGVSVGSAGDVNGDGYADVIVGASGYSNGQTSEGRAHVYHGSALGLDTTANWTDESDQVYASFGWSVRTTGDVNGDGYDDVIVGAPYYDNAQMDEGRAYVYHGSAAGLNLSPAWMAEGDQTSAEFGRSAGATGDINGDGYDDAVVGAPYYDNGEDNEGRAYVYHGSETGLSTTPDWTGESDQAGAFLSCTCFGISVATAGDIDGDGYADVVIGADHYDNGEEDEGTVFVYTGSAASLGTVANWTVGSDQAYANLGYSVGPAGDVNADGFGEVIAGAPYYDYGQTDEGVAAVFYGRRRAVQHKEPFEAP